MKSYNFALISNITIVTVHILCDKTNTLICTKNAEKCFCITDIMTKSLCNYCYFAYYVMKQID